MNKKIKTTRLKELRLENNLTQQDVAKVLNVERASYGRYENGERRLDIDILWTLADFYKVSIDYLVGRED